MMIRDAMKGKRFWANITLTLVIVGVLCALGAWQLQRLYWKNDLIAALNDKTLLQAAPNLPIDAISPSDPKPVLFFGHYQPDLTILFKQRDHMVVYMPFQTDKGEMVLMRRGIIPIQDMAGKVIDEGAQKMQVSVIGVPVPRPAAIPMMGEPFPNGLVWSVMDWGAVQTRFSYFKFAPYIVQVLEDPTSSLNITNTAPVIRNEHLNYAIFWFVMAGVALILFGRFIVFAPRRE